MKVVSWFLTSILLQNSGMLCPLACKYTGLPQTENSDLRYNQFPMFKLQQQLL